jgi:hypothetical protein
VVPDAAVATAAALTAFVKSLSERDEAEPLRMSATSPPQSDTDEPIAAQ